MEWVRHRSGLGSRRAAAGCEALAVASEADEVMAVAARRAQKWAAEASEATERWAEPAEQTQAGVGEGAASMAGVRSAGLEEWWMESSPAPALDWAALNYVCKLHTRR